jgi:hypothetical protein
VPSKQIGAKITAVTHVRRPKRVWLPLSLGQQWPTGSLHAYARPLLRVPMENLRRGFLSFASRVRAILLGSFLVTATGVQPCRSRRALS